MMTGVIDRRVQRGLVAEGLTLVRATGASAIPIKLTLALALTLPYE
jgi:hypothetical protein